MWVPLCNMGFHLFNTPQAYKNTRGLEEGPNEFLTKFADIWGLVLPIDGVKAIQGIDCDQNYDEVQDEVRAVCSSGPLGSACFTFALELINADTVHNTISNIVENMLEKRTLGEEDRVLVLLSPPLIYIYIHIYIYTYIYTYIYIYIYIYIRLKALATVV